MIVNNKLDGILEYFTEDMCYQDEIEPGSEPYLMLYNTHVIFNLDDCPNLYYYYYSFYIYVMLIKEEGLYEI